MNLDSKKKKTKYKFLYKDIGFDSNLLILMYRWLLEAVYNNIVLLFEYHPKSFMLFLAVKKDGKSLLRLHIYTTDYKVKFNPTSLQDIKGLRKIFKYTFNLEYHYIDIKGGFNIWNNHSLFSINRKWVYLKFKIYVYKIEVLKLFKLTWVPEACRYTEKTKKLKKKYLGLITLLLLLKK